MQGWITYFDTLGVYTDKARSVNWEGQGKFYYYDTGSSYIKIFEVQDNHGNYTEKCKVNFTLFLVRMILRIENKTYGPIAQ